jgi:hypothetical protein
MMPENTTPLSEKRFILAHMWEEHRDNPFIKELFEYGDIGFPLASAIQNDIVPQTLVAEKYIDDLWQYVLDFFGVEDSGEYVYWHDIAEKAGWKWIKNEDVPDELERIQKELEEES